jgi:mono/diheme cytochrome c family protein
LGKESLNSLSPAKLTTESAAVCFFRHDPELDQSQTLRVLLSDKCVQAMKRRKVSGMASKIAAILSGVYLLASSVPALAGDPVLGREVAQKLCVNCHIVEPNGSEAPLNPDVVNPDVPSFMAIAEKPGQTESEVRGFLIDPHPPMPDPKLTAHELDNIASYIMSLKE